MNRFISEKMARIQHSGIKTILDQAQELEQSGREIIHLLIGRSDFDTPGYIKEAAKKALDDGFVHYTPTTGIPELREAIAEDLENRVGIKADPAKEIIVTAGSTSAIMTALMTVLDPGDEIIIPEPMYLFYPDWGEFLGAKAVALPMSQESGYQITESALRECLTPNSKVIFLNSPHNPTGAILDNDSLNAVAKVAKERDLFVISDEIYDMIVFEPYKHVSIASLEGMKERTLIANSFSKGFAMDGWRVGYLVGPSAIIDEIVKSQLRTIVCATSFAQYGALEALRRSREAVDEMMEEYTKRKNHVVDMIRSCPKMSCFEPQGTFYVWCRIPGPESRDSWDIAKYLLKEAGVAVTPGEVFDPKAREWIRLSFSNTFDAIRTGMDRLVEAVTTLD